MNLPPGAPTPPWGETGDLTHRDFASVSAEIQGKVKSFQVEAGQVSCGLFAMEWPTAVKTRRPSWKQVSQDSIQCGISNYLGGGGRLEDD